MEYPRPTASLEGIKQVQTLYHKDYGITLTEAEAKQLLEGVMQFIYLTEVLPALKEVGLITHTISPALDVRDDQFPS